jgi:uncharacterized protein
MVLATKSIPINGKLEGFYIQENPYAATLHKIEDFYPSPDIIQIQISPKDCKTSELILGLEMIDSMLTNGFKESHVHSIHKAKLFIFHEFSKDSGVFDVLEQINQIPLLQQLISDNGRHLLYLLYLKKKEDYNPEKLAGILEQQYPGIERIITLSHFHIEEQIEKSIKKDLYTISAVILLFISLVILLVYRSLKSLLLVAINAFFSLIPLFFFLSVLQIEINMITVTAIPLVLILSLSDSIHLMTGFYHSNTFSGKIEKTAYTINRYITPSFLTSFTTSIAFLSFLFNDSVYIREFGLISGIVAMVEFFVSFFTLPLLLELFGSKKSKSASLKFIPVRLYMVQKPGSLILIGILVLSVFFVHKLNFQTDYESFFPVNTELRENHIELRNNFQSIIGLDIIIEKKENTHPETGINQLTLNLVREIRGIEGVKRVNSYKDQLDFRQEYLKGLPIGKFDKTDNVYMLQNKSRIHVSVDNPEDISKIKAELERRTHVYDKNFEISYFSPALLFDFINASVAESLLESLLFSGLLIFLMFFLLARNLRFALASILANLVPIGALVLMFVFFKININIGTAITAVICLGFIVDDTIHILYRKLKLKEELNELTGSLFLTSFILAGSFLVFAISDFQPTRIFGQLSAAVFSIAFASDILIINWLTQKKQE